MKRASYYLLTLIVAVGLSPAALAQEDALIHSYTFEDGTAVDVVGDAAGSLQGAAAIEEGVLVLDAAGAYAEFPGNTIDIGSYEGATMTVWFQPMEGLNTGFNMLAVFGATNPDNSLGINYWSMTPTRGDDVSRAAISVGEDTEPWLAETSVDGTEIDDGAPHFMASTLNSSEITFYIDGALVGTANIEPPNVLAGVSNNVVYLGRSVYTNDPTWLGTIDEFNIYDEVLTADEIASLYEGGPAQRVAVEETDGLASGFALAQNRPNPFSGSTKIDYSVDRRSFVELSVYDLLGNRVATLVQEQKAPGAYTTTFDGEALASGVYIATMQAGSFRATKKLVLMK